MRTQILPEAYMDALFIFDSAPSSISPLSIVEFHLFSYLGCILALFNGTPISEWGYKYSINSFGFPFSAEIEEARKNLISRGLITIDSAGLQTVNKEYIKSEISLVGTFGSWDSRRIFMKYATACALTLPIGSIRYAVNSSDSTLSAIELKQRRMLLSSEDITLIYDEYKLIKSLLNNDSDDLLSPAVIWLSARVMRQGELKIAN